MRNIWPRIQRGNQPASPLIGLSKLARAGSQVPRWALQDRNACQTYYRVPQVTDTSQQSRVCLKATNNEWMPNPTSPFGLYFGGHTHWRWSLIESKWFLSSSPCTILFDFASEDSGPSLGHNPVYLWNAPTTAGDSKTSKRYSWPWGVR